jgi:ATP-dependent Clp protease ATP-binding subunit ClpA
MINPEKLTVKAGEALNEAVTLARRAGNPVVYDLHLLAALLGQDESIVVPVLQKIGVSVAALREQVTRGVDKYPKQSDAQPTMSRELNQVFDNAEDESKALGDEYISTEHLLLALANTKGTETRGLLSAAGASPEALRDALKAVPRTASRIKRRRTNTKRCSATLATSPRLREKGSSTPSSAVTRRFVASFKFSHVARRTIPCSSGSPVSARPRSWKASRNASSTEMCPKA